MAQETPIQIPEPVTAPSAPDDAVAAPPIEDPQVLPVPASAQALGEEKTRPDDAGFSGEAFAAAVRDEAIRFAAIAVARALRERLRDPDVLTAYVDSALRACGRAQRQVVRLHPHDANAYRAQRGVEVIADAGCARGEVRIEARGGEVGATIEECAELLARAAAHA